LPVVPSPIVEAYQTVDERRRALVHHQVSDFVRDREALADLAVERPRMICHARSTTLSRAGIRGADRPFEREISARRSTRATRSRHPFAPPQGAPRR
jgi:hypothetical protein